MFYLISFILFITTFQSHRKTNNRILFNSIYFVTGTLFLAETLSLFRSFDLLTIRVVLTVLFFLYLIYLYRHGSATGVRYSMNKGILWVLQNKGFAIMSISVFAAVTISGLQYFPTNPDSNVYHLPRLIMWLQQGHFNHFETPVYRMVYQPYLTELLMAFIYATGGPISILSMWSVIMLLLNLWILEKFVAQLPQAYRLPRRHLLIVILLCWSILLQATTTLNDIHLLFYLLIFNCLIWKNSLTKEEYIIMIVSLVLGYLTKGTFSIYFVGNMFLWVVVKLANGTLWGGIRGLLFLSRSNKFGLLCLMLLLLPTAARNFNTSGSILGVNIEEKALYFNDGINLSSGLSNTIKNVMTNAATPFPVVNEMLYKFTLAVHEILGLPDLNDGGLNWLGMNYDLRRGIHLFFYPEVMTNSLLWFCVGIIMIVVLIRGLIVRKKGAELVFLQIKGVSLIFLFFFSVLLRWQPWHARLLMPVFLILSYGVVLYVSQFKIYKIFFGIVYITGLFCLLFNANRPLIPFKYFTATDFTYMDGSILVKSQWEKEYGYTQINEIIGLNKKICFFMSDSNTPIFHFMYLSRHTHNKFAFFGNFKNPTNRYKKNNQVRKFDYAIVAAINDEAFKKEFDINYTEPVFSSGNFILYKMK